MGAVNKADMLFKEYQLAINTQIHFNDMLWKMRSLMLTTILAVFTVAITMAARLPTPSQAQNETTVATDAGGTSLEDELHLGDADGVATIESLSRQVQQLTILIEELRRIAVSPRSKADVVVVGAGMLFIFVIFFLDFCYFYRLLLGAVRRSTAIEETAKSCDLELNTTGSINKVMPMWAANTCVVLFYAIPFVAGLAYILYQRNLWPF